MNEALYLLGFSPRLISRGSILNSRGLWEDRGAESMDVEYFDPGTLALAELFEIERLELGPVFAWFKRIDRFDFVGEAGERNLSDIEWLTPRVMAHEEAVGQLCMQSSFYPARFGSLFSTEAALESFTRSVVPTLNDFFKLIRGKQEWGLKLFGNYAKLARIQAEQSGLLKDGVPTKGANYLKLKQLQREIAKSNAENFQQNLDMVKRSIREVFANVVERTINSTSKGDANEELVANIAILELANKRDHVDSWVREWNAKFTEHNGIRMELTGPWPAYSFCPSLTNAGSFHPSSQHELTRGVA